MNYYELLDIARDADKPQIKRAYFSMVKAHSPDKDPEGFKAIRLAYETLSDDKQRAAYDTYFDAAGDAQNELLAARELLRQNKYKEAVAFLAALIAEKPTAANTEAMRLYACALWQCRKSGKAEDICKALLKENPKDVETLLLRADIAASRGHTNKAFGYYKDAIALDQTDPKTWIQYMHYLLEHQPWQVTDAGLQAISLNPNMFRDEYILYLHCVCNNADLISSLFDDESDDSDESGYHTSEASKYTAHMLLRCFGLFTECFIADPYPSQARYQSVLNALPCVMRKPAYYPYIEKLLAVLEQYRHRDKADDMKFKTVRAVMAVQTLHDDERIHDVLAELTGYLLAGDVDPADRFKLEFFIVNELPGIRKFVKALRKAYPEYFKLNQAFYMDVLSPRKAEFLMDKYYALYKRFRAKENAFAAADDTDDDMDDDDILRHILRGIYDDDLDDDLDDNLDDDLDDDTYDNAHGGTYDGPPGSMRDGRHDGRRDDDDSVFGYDSSETEKPYVRETPKVGRNDPCPCGSGKKYKRCCGR